MTLRRYLLALVVLAACDRTVDLTDEPDAVLRSEGFTGDSVVLDGAAADGGDAIDSGFPDGGDVPDGGSFPDGEPAPDGVLDGP